MCDAYLHIFPDYLTICGWRNSTFLQIKFSRALSGRVEMIDVLSMGVRGEREKRDQSSYMNRGRRETVQRRCLQILKLGLRIWMIAVNSNRGMRQKDRLALVVVF